MGTACSCVDNDTSADDANPPFASPAKNLNNSIKHRQNGNIENGTIIQNDFGKNCNALNGHATEISNDQLEPNDAKPNNCDIDRANSVKRDKQIDVITNEKSIRRGSDTNSDRRASIISRLSNRVSQLRAESGNSELPLEDASQILSEYKDILKKQGSLDDELTEEQYRMMAGELLPLVSRLENAIERLERYQPTNTPQLLKSPPPQEVCTFPSVVAYDELLSGPFKSFLDCSGKIGGEVSQISKMVDAAFKTQRAFIVAAAKSKKPSDKDLPQLLEPTGKKLQEIIDFRETKRQSSFFNHLSAISEAIPGLSWVTVAPTPAPYVKEMGDAAVFYTNRVLKDYREKDKLHVEWVQHWNNVFAELQAYIKQFHTTGLSWNPNGTNALDNLKAPSTSAPAPPPPAGNIPPPPPMIKLEPKPMESVPNDGRADLFKSLNKGTDITSGLKKVSDDMKTHKNPSLRGEGLVTTKGSSPAPGARGNSPFSGPAKPPKFALEGKKWFVEYQKDQKDLCVSKTNMDQCVYIYRCENTVIQVKGKINSIYLDSCKKTAVVFDSLVSSMEIVNCQSCQMQVMQAVPTITIEKTDGAQVYLSKDSLHCEIISAKSSEMNILIPKEDGEFVECAVPEQFKTLIKGTSLVTSCTEKAG